MKYYELVEAEHHDFKKIELANSHFENIQKRLKGRKLSDPFFYRVKFPDTDHITYVFDYLSDLAIGFSIEYDDARASLRFNKETKDSVIIVYYRNHPRNLAKFFSSMKSNFRHEFFHYLDLKRDALNHIDSQDSTDLDNYFNSPVEFNAFYLQGLSTIHDWYQKTNQRHFLSRKIRLFLIKLLSGYDVSGADFEEFYRFSKNAFNYGFLKHQNPKYKRKLMKRLYGYYQRYIKQ